MGKNSVILVIFTELMLKVDICRAVLTHKDVGVKKTTAKSNWEFQKGPCE